MTCIPEKERGPLLGEPAPHFTALLQNQGSRKRKVEHWTVFISHPKDLLPFLRIKTVNYILCKRNIKVIAIPDRLTGENLEEGNFFEKYIVRHNFSFTDDAEGVLSASYGISTEERGTNAAKGLFVIDPKGILRMKIFSPLDSTRNFPEILSLIESMQAAYRTEKKNSKKTSAEDFVISSGITLLTGKDFQEI